MAIESTDQRKAAQSATQVVDPQMLEVLKLAIGAHPMAVDLGDEVVLELAEEAILEGTFNDPKWLDLKLSAITGVELDSEDFEIASSESPVVISEEDIELDAKQTTIVEPVKLPFEEIKRSHCALIETQHDLDDVIKTHAEWIKNVLHPKNSVTGGRANLSGADLREFKLEGADLRGANLDNTVMDGMDLTNVNFTTASLKGSSLKEAILYKAKLKRANLSGAELLNANITDCDLRRATFKDTNLDGVVLANGIFDEGVREKLEAKEYDSKPELQEPEIEPACQMDDQIDENPDEHSSPDEILIM